MRTKKQLEEQIKKLEKENNLLKETIKLLEKKNKICSYQNLKWTIQAAKESAFNCLCKREMLECENILSSLRETIDKVMPKGKDIIALLNNKTAKKTIIDDTLSDEEKFNKLMKIVEAKNYSACEEIEVKSLIPSYKKLL